MNKAIILCSVTVILFVSIIHTGAEIIAGPITNPTNGHDYYLLAPNTWMASETEAESLGGTLAIVRTAAEQEWIFSKFGSYGGINRIIWIGLHRQYPGGPFAWTDGEPVNYLNWQAGQPDNSGGAEDSVVIWSPEDQRSGGTWNDERDAEQHNAVVELPGKLELKSLNEAEKSLIGTWYEHGDGSRPCWIAGTDRMLFAIDHDRSTSRLVSASEGALFAVNWKQHAEILKDRILWSKGNWWSRKPVDYK